MTQRHVFFYVQHLLGIGHLARASRIAQALQAEGLRVTLVTGGVPVPGFPPKGLAQVTLPPLAVRDGGFAGLVDAQGTPVNAAYMAARQAELLAAFHAARPDIVMIEQFPFGRRQVRDELMALIAAAEAAQPRPRIVASLRDILQRRQKAGRDTETLAVVQAHFDRVLVHGDPVFAALEDSFPFAAEIADKVIYTGLVCAPPPPPPVERFAIVVSAGGGAVGAGLVRAAMEAARLRPGRGRWCVIAGPNMPQADFDALAAITPPEVALERFRTDFRSLLSAARLSVSQAGYNTVGDVLQAGCRMLLVPFAAEGETEQTDRAERLAALGRAEVLTEDRLDGPAMAEAITRALDGPEPQALAQVSIDGARTTARILRDL